MDKNTSAWGGALANGVALAITAAIAYTACALAFRAWPEASMAFMNALFHGLDFSKLARGPAAFDFGGFAYALLVTVIWAFVLGAVFGWLSDRLRSRRLP